MLPEGLAPGGWSVRLLLALLCLSLVAGCSVPVVKPGWQDASGTPIEQLQVEIAPAASTTREVRFVPADNESNGLTVRAGGDQVAWLRVSPDRFLSVDAGAAYPLSISVTAPVGTPAGTYQASVSLLTGEKVVSKLRLALIVR